MSFVAFGLDPAAYRPLFGLADADLAASGARRYVSDAAPGYPCRVSVSDAPVGTPLLLVNHPHQTADTPYRASGPIFIAETDAAPAVYENALPPTFRGRTMSLRAYDAEGWMLDADIVAGEDAAALIARLFDDPHTAYLHAHYAKRGCFACRIERG